MNTKGKTTERLAVSVPDAAVMFGVSDETVWSWIYERRLASVKLGRCRRITLKEIERFMEENTITRVK